MGKAVITASPADAAETAICLKDLVNQIESGRLTDELGHDFRLNDAYLRAVELLDRLEGEAGQT